MSLPPSPADPFPAPQILSGKRSVGVVASDLEEWAASMEKQQPLQRQTSMAGNILLVADQQPPNDCGYLLQRKMRECTHGSVRLGYRVYKKDGVWHLQEESGGAKEEQRVHVKVQNKKSLYESDPETSELAALQWISQRMTSKAHHLLAPVVVVADAKSIYTISPFHEDGTLFDYMDRVGRLSESQARFFFRQLLSALRHLKDLQVCNGNISLDTLLLSKGSQHLTIGGWDHACRLPPQGGDVAPRSVAGGTIPAFVAPEVLASEPWQGTAADLWSSMVVLIVLVCGNDNEILFSAPVPEDKKFQKLCVKGEALDTTAMNVKLTTDFWGMIAPALRCNREERWNLDQVDFCKWAQYSHVTAPVAEQDESWGQSSSKS